MSADRLLLHGTCVAYGERAVLLTGPSGSGKSDLALRLLHLQIKNELLPEIYPLRLVADDQVSVTEVDGNLLASSPETLFGKIEVRGVGILSVAALEKAWLKLIIQLVERDHVPRLPLDHETSGGPAETLLGVTLPVLQLNAFEPSSALKVFYALQDEIKLIR